MAASVASGSKQDRIKKSARRDKLSPAKDSGVRRRQKAFGALGGFADAADTNVHAQGVKGCRCNLHAARFAQHGLAGGGQLASGGDEAEQEVCSGGNSLG